MVAIKTKRTEAEAIEHARRSPQARESLEGMEQLGVAVVGDQPGQRFVAFAEGELTELAALAKQNGASPAGSGGDTQSRRAGTASARCAAQRDDDRFPEAWAPVRHLGADGSGDGGPAYARRPCVRAVVRPLQAEEAITWDRDAGGAGGGIEAVACCAPEQRHLSQHERRRGGCSGCYRAYTSPKRG
jgi:hypothetical protein